MRKLLALTAILLVALSGCAAKTFTGTEFNAIVLGKNDAPRGLTYIQQGSGSQPLDQVESDPANQTKLKSYGFQYAYESFFANNEAIAILAQQTQQASPGAKIVATLAIAFKTADGAHKAIALEHQSDLSTGTDIRTVSVGKIGDETIAESGRQKDAPFPGFLVYWREGNAIFAVLVAGGPTAGASINEATAYANTMHNRATKA